MYTADENVWKELELQLLPYENHIDTGGGMTGIHFFQDVRGAELFQL